MSKYVTVGGIEVNHTSKADAKEFDWLIAKTHFVVQGGVKSFNIENDGSKIKHTFVSFSLTNKQAKALRNALNEVFGDE